VRADGLLGFEYCKEDEEIKKGKPKEQKKMYKVDIKDSEGVDFSFYFSERYNFINDKRKKDHHHHHQKGGYPNNKFEKGHSYHEEKDGKQPYDNKDKGSTNVARTMRG